MKHLEEYRYPVLAGASLTASPPLQCGSAGASRLWRSAAAMPRPSAGTGSADSCRRDPIDLGSGLSSLHDVGR